MSNLNGGRTSSIDLLASPQVKIYHPKIATAPQPLREKCPVCRGRLRLLIFRLEWKSKEGQNVFFLEKYCDDVKLICKFATVNLKVEIMLVTVAWVVLGHQIQSILTYLLINSCPRPRLIEERSTPCIWWKIISDVLLVNTLYYVPLLYFGLISTLHYRPGFGHALCMTSAIFNAYKFRWQENFV